MRNVNSTELTSRLFQMRNRWDSRKDSKNYTKWTQSYEE